MHDLIDDLETVTPDIWVCKDQEFKEKLKKLPNWFKIPLINCNASHNLADGSLVRFRGMVQDMHNSEFFFESYEVYNSVTNEVKVKSGKYRDTANILKDEKINYTENFKSAERHTFVVVSMPGLNDWVQQLEEKQNHLKHLGEQPNTSKRAIHDAGSKLKRSYEETTEEGADVMDVEIDENVNKEVKTDDTKPIGDIFVSREHLLNFPLPDVPSKSCLVKIYEDEYMNLKINDMVEIIGFLSVDPALSGEFHSEGDSEMEMITHNPPPSLIPRLHAVHYVKLEHCNPLVTNEFDQAAVLKEANVAREHLLKALTELLLGDSLAAEYLICHLISSVYLREETLALGRFCLNLSNLPIAKYPGYGKQLYDIIKEFVTKSYYLPLTVDNMNTMTLLPKKDYESNRLTSGILQLSPGTHLVVDETQMKEGWLDAAGVGNVTALGNLIQYQKVEYDFNFYKIEFNSDVPVLLLSEGKCLLPNDYHVPLKPEESSLEIFNAIVEAATYYLKEDIMNLIRTFLTNMRRVKYTIREDLQYVQDDFIELRKNSTPEDPITADDMHRLLVLARLVSLSRGHDTLTKECWDIAMRMEKERRQRVRNKLTTTL